MGAGGQQDAEAFQLAPVGAHDFNIAAHVQALHPRQQEFRAKALGLLAHGLRQLRTAGALYTGVVDHLMGDGDLAAEALLLHHDHTIPGSRQVNSGCQTCRAAANHHNII